MIKKIGIEALRPGMFVSDFNAGWLDHPFLRNSLPISTEAQVAKVRSCGIRELFIDTERGADVADAPTHEEVAAETARQLHQLHAGPSPADQPPPRQPPAPLASELPHARAAFSEATRIVHRVMDDIRLGRQVEVQALTPVVEKITDSVIRNPNAMLTMRRIKQRDDYTFLHSVSVCAILTSFARSLGMSLREMQAVALGGLIHDLGKVRVPQAILNKPGKLDDLEFEQMKQHVPFGLELVRDLPDLPPIAVEVLEMHHERYDGSGYPARRQGPAIGRYGRMAAIVDVYDAITSDRVYHKGMGPALAMQRLFEWSKFHFDPDLVQAFIRSVGIYPVGTLVRLDSGRLGIVIEQREGQLLQPVVRIVFDTRHGHFLPPEDLDLAAARAGGERIAGHEPADKWPIDLQRFIDAG